MPAKEIHVCLNDEIPCHSEVDELDISKGLDSKNKMFNDKSRFVDEVLSGMIMFI